MKDRILTVSMLVSGREETTEKSLLSLQPLREILGAEIILTDTGCSAEYLDTIKGLADKVLTFEWCNDFAKARNLGLKVASGKWFMFIDDDEWFEDVTPIIDFFQSGEYEEYHQAVYIQRNYSDFEGREYTDDWASRMIRIEEDTHFEGAVHEFMIPAKGKCKRIEAFVHHYGYVFATGEASLAHFKRNVDILQGLLEREPNNMRWPLQMIKELQGRKKYQEMKKTAEEALVKISEVDEFFMNMCRGAFYIAILEAELNAECYDELWNAYEEFSQNEKNPWNVRCAMAAYVLLYAPCNEEKMQKYVEDYAKGLELYENRQYNEQQEIIAESIVYVSEYMYSLVNFAEKVRLELAEKGDFLFLSDRVWSLARLGVLPLEDMLLELPMKQWMVQMQIFLTQGYSVALEQIGSNLASICTRNDVRYIYFDYIIETIKMKQIYSLEENVLKMDYVSMTKFLEEFAQANLNYLDYMYTEATFENDMELFSPEEKAAIWIGNGLSIDNGQWRMKLQYFGEAAKVCPMLATFIKRYMQLFGEQLMN